MSLASLASTGERSSFHRPRGPQVLKHLLPGPSEKEFANPGLESASQTWPLYILTFEKFANLQADYYLAISSGYFYLNKFFTMETFNSKHIKVLLLALNKS